MTEMLECSRCGGLYPPPYTVGQVIWVPNKDWRPCSCGGPTTRWADSVEARLAKLEGLEGLAKRAAERVRDTVRESSWTSVPLAILREQHHREALESAAKEIEKMFVEPPAVSDSDFKYLGIAQMVRTHKVTP